MSGCLYLLVNKFTKYRHINFHVAILTGSGDTARLVKLHKNIIPIKVSARANKLLVIRLGILFFDKLKM